MAVIRPTGYLSHYGFSPEETDDYLEHYGVKGMKWGKRKKANFINTKITGSYYKQRAAQDQSDMAYAAKRASEYKSEELANREAAAKSFRSASETNAATNIQRQSLARNEEAARKARLEQKVASNAAKAQTQQSFLKLGNAKSKSYGQQSQAAAHRVEQAERAAAIDRQLADRSARATQSNREAAAQHTRAADRARDNSKTWNATYERSAASAKANQAAYDQSVFGKISKVVTKKRKK